MQKFEKISFNQFQKDVSSEEILYQEYSLPVRKTKHSAAYDIEALSDGILHPGEIQKIPTGLKVCMEEGIFLMIVVRSSMGFKYNVRMCNQVGIIDKDYYENPTNEGHIFIALQNEGDRDFVYHKGDAIAQGIFMRYYKTDDDEAEGIRISGFGSTNKGE